MTQPGWTVTKSGQQFCKTMAVEILPLISEVDSLIPPK